MQEFLSKFSQVAPSTLAPPSFPTDFMPAGPKTEEGAASTAIPDKLTFSFYLPHSTVNQKQQVRATSAFDIQRRCQPYPST